MAFRVTSINNKGSAIIDGSNVVTTGMTDKDHMHVEENFLNNAGVITSADFVVSQRAAGVNRSVDVSAGSAYVLNHSWSLNSIAQTRFWQVINSAVVNVPLTTNTSGNPRIDLICIEIDTAASPGADGDGSMDIIVVEGTPAASPVAPAVPDDCLLLAQVAVANGYASIVDANITDKRVFVSGEMSNKGWLGVSETWEYASATSVTIPSGGASRYQKGMPFKLSAGGVEKQGYIVGVADTTLTLLGDAITNTELTKVYIARPGVVPFGFTEWFAYTPTYGASGSMTFSTVTTTVAKFKIVGTMCQLQVRAIGTTGGTANTDITITPPVNSANAYSSLSGACTFDGGSPRCTARVLFNNNVALISIGLYNGGNYGLGANRDIFVNGSYQF